MPVGVVVVGMSAVAWWPAFTLGAWGELFFDDLLGLWAASTAAFVYVLVEKRPLGGRLLRALILLLPSVWLIVSLVSNVQDPDDIGTAIVDIVALFVVIIGIPFTLWVLVRIVWPDFADETRRSAKWLIVFVVLGIVLVSFVLGVNQELFLTCEDFAISGNSEPDGCVHLED